MCLQIWKLYDIVTDIDRLVSCLLKKNANITLINKNTDIIQKLLLNLFIYLFGLCFHYCKSK